MTITKLSRVPRLGAFRRTLQAIVLAGLPVAAGCAGETVEDQISGCDRQEVTNELELPLPAEPSMHLRLESCRLDVDACRVLCRMAMNQGGLRSVAQPPITRCDVEFFPDRVTIAATYETIGCNAEGRRPSGLRAPSARTAQDRAGAWLAEATWLEAASIYAFAELARELSQRGAPAVLVRAAMVAANDEIRHTRLMGGLARRYGAELEEPVVAAMAPRSLEAMAIENAVEGCVRETWGAVSALWQSHTAVDLEARAVFTAIASDEIRHAKLAWSIESWLAPQLPAAARARVEAARAEAARQLLDGHDALPALGLPDALQARGLLARTSASLWKGALS